MALGHKIFIAGIRYYFDALCKLHGITQGIDMFDDVAPVFDEVARNYVAGGYHEGSAEDGRAFIERNLMKHMGLNLN